MIEGMTIPELVSQHFIKIQVVLFVSGVLVAFKLLQGKQTSTQFKSREADRNDLERLRRGGPDLAQAKIARAKPTANPASNPAHSASPPLSLPGIRLSGLPHEILGVAEDASEADVLKAYKESIKRFHPDRIQGQAKEQLQFYQEASAKLNQAKEDLIRAIRARR
jgi:DnaJ-domain-containing protein 1